MSIIIDKEFKEIIPPLTAEEYAGLELNILEEGCRDAIVTWNGIIVDGHNRYDICTSHNIPFKTIEKDFESRNDAKIWIMRNQLARRNLTEGQHINIVRQCESAIKKKARERQAEYYGNQYDSGLVEKFPQVQTSKSRDELGKIAGVSGKTYEHGSAVFEKAPEPVVNAYLRDELSTNAAYQVTKMEPEQQEEVAERIEHGESPKDVVQEVIHRPHVSNNSGNNEWYTPKQYIELAREVLGEIDVDPASCEYANETVMAKQFYSIENDGLTKHWYGKVWMNPPYAADFVSRFTEKFIEEYDNGNITEGIVLVNNATETSWFINMVQYAKAVVFPKGRIRYESPTKETNAPLQGQAFIYFGENAAKFISTFSSVGWAAVIGN